MLDFLFHYKSLIVIGILISVLGIMSMALKAQINANYAKQIKIESLEFQQKQLQDSLKKAVDNQKMAEEQMQLLENDNVKIEHNYEAYHGKLREVFNGISWDDQKIPSSVICLLNCVRTTTGADYCKCPANNNPKHAKAV